MKGKGRLLIKLEESSENSLVRQTNSNEHSAVLKIITQKTFKKGFTLRTCPLESDSYCLYEIDLQARLGVVLR